MEAHMRGDASSDSLLGPDDQSAATSRAAQSLVDAIAALPGDSLFILESLAETASSLQAAVPAAPVDPDSRRFLVESGTFTKEALDAAESKIARGSLAIHRLRNQLILALQTYSIEEAGAFLKEPAEVVRERLDRRELIAYDVADRLRLPTWQFVPHTPDRLLPGLSRLVPALSALGQLNAAGFMSTPQEDLVEHGARTPTDWLSDGGDISAVEKILDSEA